MELGVQPGDETALHLRHLTDGEEVPAVFDDGDGGALMNALGHSTHFESPLARQGPVLEGGHLGSHARSSAAVAD